MLIKDLLKQFNLNLDLTDDVLNIEITGDYTTYQLLKDEEGEYYYFKDDTHELIIDENNFNETIVFTTVIDDRTSHAQIYNSFGGMIGHS